MQSVRPARRRGADGGVDGRGRGRGGAEPPGCVQAWWFVDRYLVNFGYSWLILDFNVVNFNFNYRLFNLVQCVERRFKEKSQVTQYTNIR